MNHISFHIRSRQADEATGKLTSARISQLSHDLSFEAYDLNLILHALSAPGWTGQAQSDFILDTGQLDNELWLLG